VQREIAGLRESAQQSSWLRLKVQLAANHQGYRAPTAAWRFYVGLPFVDHLMEPTGGPGIPAPAYPYPDFSRAYFTTMKNLTLHEMVITAIALRRYELRHGKPPGSLALLVPDFLAAPPSDLMDGQPLRYRLNSEGSFPWETTAKMKAEIHRRRILIKIGRMNLPGQGVIGSGPGQWRVSGLQSNLSSNGASLGRRCGHRAAFTGYRTPSSAALSQRAGLSLSRPPAIEAKAPPIPEHPNTTSSIHW
jgi:hypothetical protein